MEPMKNDDGDFLPLEVYYFGLNSKNNMNFTIYEDSDYGPFSNDTSNEVLKGYIYKSSSMSVNFNIR